MVWLHPVNTESKKLKEIYALFHSHGTKFRTQAEPKDQARNTCFGGETLGKAVTISERPSPPQEHFMWVGHPKSVGRTVRAEKQPGPPRTLSWAWLSRAPGEPGPLDVDRPGLRLYSWGLKEEGGDAQWAPCFVRQARSPEWEGPTSQLQFEDKTRAPASCLRQLLSGCVQSREGSIPWPRPQGSFCRHSSCHLPLSLLSRGHAFRPPGSRQQVTSAEGTGCDLPALTATPRPLLRIPPDPASQMLPFLSNEDESHLQKLTSTKPFPRTKCAPHTRLSAFNVFSLNFTKALG